MQMGEDAASLDRHCEIDRVDRSNPVHPAEGEDDIVTVFRRNSAADQPGVAALRHDRQPRLSADLGDCGDLGGRSRPHDELCRAAIEPTGLYQIRLLVPRVGDPPRGADRLFDPM